MLTQCRLRLFPVESLSVVLLLAALLTFAVPEQRAPASGPDVLTGPRVTNGVFSPGPDMNNARMMHSGAPLPDGRMVLFGGHTAGMCPLLTSEVYSPTTNTFSLHTMQYAHDGGSIVRLANGLFLLAGGWAGCWGTDMTRTAEIYNPADDSFTPTAGQMTQARAWAGAALLTSGKVLFAGTRPGLVSAEVYDPVTQTFTPTVGALNAARAIPIVFPTVGGGAYVIGGESGEQVEEYDPATGTFQIVRATLFEGESGWQTMLTEFRPSLDLQLPDGRYIMNAWRSTGSGYEYTLWTFSPVTKQIAKLPTATGIPPSNMPIVDGNHGRVYVLSLAPSPANVWQLTTVDLRSGIVRTEPETYTPGYLLTNDLTGMLMDRRILVTGGCVSGNADPVTATFFVLPPPFPELFLPAIMK